MPETNNKCLEPCATILKLTQELSDMKKQNGDDHKEIRERITKLELADAIQGEQFRAIIDKIDVLTASHNKILEKLEPLSIESQKVEGLDARVTALESKPGKRWEMVVEKVLLVIVAAVVGMVLSKVGL